MPTLTIEPSDTDLVGSQIVFKAGECITYQGCNYRAKRDITAGELKHLQDENFSGDAVEALYA